MIQIYEFNELMAYIKKRDASRDQRDEERFGRFKDEMLEAIAGRDTAKDFYTTKELGEALGITAETVRKNYINKGLVTTVQDPSGKHKISREEFVRVRKQHEGMRGFN
ncbi:MAG: hypothetical protein ACKVH8_24990 [Pirellulales bacterium]|jgi:hypothetical protein